MTEKTLGIFVTMKVQDDTKGPYGFLMTCTLGVLLPSHKRD